MDDLVKMREEALEKRQIKQIELMEKMLENKKMSS